MSVILNLQKLDVQMVKECIYALAAVLYLWSMELIDNKNGTSILRDLIDIMILLKILIPSLK